MEDIKNCSKESSDILDRLQQIKHVVLDLDGTIYSGGTIFPYTIDFINTLKELGISYSFLTNNSSKGVTDHLLKLSNMGLDVSSEDLYTSGDAIIQFILTHHPEWKHLFILGTNSLITQFENTGFIIIDENCQEAPDALIVAFDTTLTYGKLCRAAWWAKQGTPYLSTNPDLMCPSDEDIVLVDCGAICSCIEAATGRKPDKVLGKPQTDMLAEIITLRNMEPNQIAMVGDRIYTDMVMAHDIGAFSVLVLSGETNLHDIKTEFSSQLDLIVPSIKELGELLLIVNGLESTNTGISSLL